MSYQTLLVDIVDNVATITINRPDAANAMSPLCAREFSQVANSLDSDASVRAIVITGAGKMKFKHIIHAVGPKMGEGDEDRKLSSAVRSSEVSSTGRRSTRRTSQSKPPRAGKAQMRAVTGR